MTGNRNLPRRIRQLEDRLERPGSMEAYFDRSIPIMKAMLDVADGDWHASGGWIDPQASLFALDGPSTWPELDDLIDAYVSELEAKA